MHGSKKTQRPFRLAKRFFQTGKISKSEILFDELEIYLGRTILKNIKTAKLFGSLFGTMVHWFKLSFICAKIKNVHPGIRTNEI